LCGERLAALHCVHRRSDGTLSGGRRSGAVRPERIERELALVGVSLLLVQTDPPPVLFRPTLVVRGNERHLQFAVLPRRAAEIVAVADAIALRQAAEGLEPAADQRRDAFAVKAARIAELFGVGTVAWLDQAREAARLRVALLA